MEIAPERKEVPELKFSRVCNLRLFPSNLRLDRKYPLNIVATSNKYGLIFAGTTYGVQCIPLANVIELQERRPNNRGVIENYVRRDLKLGCIPSHIAINSTGDLLAIVIPHQNCPILQIYVVQSFASQDVAKLAEVRLSSTPGTLVLDLQWNPAVGNTIGAVISDGSAIVGEINLSGGAPTISVAPPDVQAMCLCWSPKGKQVVLGSKSGNLTQFKPDLKPVKSYPPPQIPNSQLEVVSVHWISSFQFLGVYKDRIDQLSRSAVMVVNVPKSGQQSFINYEDICFGNDSKRHEHYFIHLAQWNLIFISTGNGLEVSVLCQEGESWVQWMQDEGGRAELPQTEDHDDVFSVGMALNLNATKPIPIGDSGSIPPMPYLLYMSEEGVLCFFHAINQLPSGAASLCVPPQELPKQFFTAPEGGEPAAQTLSQPVQPQKPAAALGIGSGESVPAAPAVAKPPLFPPLPSSPYQLGGQPGLSGSQLPSFSMPFGGLATQTPPTQASVPPGQIKTPLLSFPQGMANSPFAMGSLQPTSSSGSLFGGTLSSKPAELVQTSSAITSLAQGGLSLQFSSASAPTSTISIPSVPKPQVSVISLSSPSSGSPAPAVVTFQPPAAKEVPRVPTPPPPVDDSMILKEITKEVASFETLLANFKLNTAVVDRLINDKSSIPSITVKLDDLEKFEKELRETTATEQAEVNALKLNLIEMWGWLENIKAKQRLTTSQRYLDAVESKDLDPMMKKIMKSIEQNSLYVEIKIKEATDHLNSIWEKQKEPGSLKNFDIPNMEVIFQTMATIMRILNVQQTRISELESKLASTLKARKKTIPQLLNDSNPRRNYNHLSTTEQNSQFEKLADKLLQTRIDSNSESNSRSFKETANRYIAVSSTRKPLPVEKEAALWRWHKAHKVIRTKVNRTAVPDNELLNRISMVKLTPTKTPPVSKSSAPIVETPQISSTKPVSRNLFVTPGFQPSNMTASPSMVTSTPAIGSFKTSGPKLAGKSFPSPLSPVEVSAQITSNAPMEPKLSLSLPAAPKNAFNSPLSSVISSSKEQTASQPPAVSQKASFTVTTSTTATKPPTSTSGQLSFGNLNVKPKDSTKSPFVSTKENQASLSSEPQKSASISDVKPNSPALPGLLSGQTPFGDKDKATIVSSTSSGSIFGNFPFSQSFSFASSGTSVFGGGSPSITTSTAPTSSTATSGSKTSIFAQALSPSSVGTSAISAFSFTSAPAPTDATVAVATTTSTFPTSSTAPSALNLFSFTQAKTISSTASSPAVTSSSNISLAPSATQASSPSLLGGPLPTTTVIAPQPSQPSSTVTPSAQTAQSTPATTSVSVFSGVAPTPTPTTPPTSTQPATPEKPATPSISTSSLSFGNMTLTPAATSAPTSTTATTFSFSGTPAAPNIFASPQSQSTITFGSSQFGLVTTASSVFGTTVTPPATTSNTLFQTPQKSANAFSAVTSAVFGTPTSSSPSTFASPATPAQPSFGTATSPNQPSFGTPTTSAQPTFGTTTTPLQQTFGTPTTTVQSTFGAPTTSAQPSFGTAVTSASVFSSTNSSSVFGTPTTTTSSVFGAANALSNTSFFGSSTTTAAAFGSTPAASIFGGASSFSSPTTTSSNIFGATICSPNVSTAPTSTNVFGLPFESSASSTAFGGTPPFGSFKPSTPGAFGATSGSSIFGGSSTFGQQPQQGGLFQSASSSPSVFGSPGAQTQSPGAFSGGGQTVQQTGFGAFGRGTQSPQQPRPFGASGVGGAVFGGQATFGSAPAFGGSAFGGSPNKVFGSPTPAPAFGSPTQQSSTFENLASQNTVSFGNLAQNQQPSFGSSGATAFGQQQQQPQPQQQPAFSNTPAFGGSSFSSWR